EHGYLVHLARNGREALELVEHIGHPCLILLDLMMPVMDGWEFLAKLKTLDGAAESADINLSALTERMPSGHPVMQKPADFNRLLRLVQEYCPAAAREPQSGGFNRAQSKIPPDPSSKRTPG